PGRGAGLAVCAWWLAHWSVGGADGVFVGSLGGYVRVVACTLWMVWGVWLVVGLWEWLFSAVVVFWERRLVGYV
ncbi:hypothetical protein, partial [Pseudoscardovia suis]